MKARKNELDVDFIGGTEPLTKEEEKRISEVIEKLKAKQSVVRKPSKKAKTREKTTTQLHTTKIVQKLDNFKFRQDRDYYYCKSDAN